MHHDAFFIQLTKYRLKSNIKGNREMDVDIGELEDKCRETMMLKFGRVVDIDNLGMITVSRAVEEARIVAAENERKLANIEHSWNKKIISMKDILTGLWLI